MVLLLKENFQKIEDGKPIDKMIQIMIRYVHNPYFHRIAWGPSDDPLVGTAVVFQAEAPTGNHAETDAHWYSDLQR